MVRAAKDVHLAQSSVSDQIQVLEEELGTALFERTRQGTQLTEAGQALLPYAKEMVALEHDAHAAVGNAVKLRSRPVTIGTLEAVASNLLSGWLSCFAAEHPHISVNMPIGSSGDLLRQLEDGQLDLALVLDRGSRDHRFRYREIAKEPLVLIAPPYRTADASDLAALAKESFVATEQGCVYRHLFDRAFEEAGLRAPSPATEAGSINSIIRMVAAGTGIALVPRFAASDALARGEVIDLEWPGKQAAATLQLAWSRRRKKPSGATALADFIIDRMSRLTPADDHPRRAALTRS